ncbi:GntR family transcriptional regulator [Geobacter sp. FeAm09]|uniref:GntR family transcriptional regulator n=1 Tax=Geobacter sp. FeAm09 TaxID=2597769 RepID=UPI001F0CF7C1|nr:winged helix-turn-helix domain-containing protein [Geobacter sp. FeAm09]
MIDATTVPDSMAPLYERVAGEMATLIGQGTFRAGDRVPSIRQLSRRFDVSINTAMQAYALLEDQRLIEARPQSGYYVRARAPEIASPPTHHRRASGRPRSPSASSATR